MLFVREISKNKVPESPLLSTCNNNIFKLFHKAKRECFCNVLVEFNDNAGVGKLDELN